MANIDTLVQELGQLTVLEALELSKKLSKEWNIDLDNMMSAPAPAPAEATESATATATVMLTGFDPARKMQVLKLVKTLNELGLMEAKTFVESVPKAVKEDIDKVEAEQIKKQLEEAGGTVDLTSSIRRFI
jgi:large subunit ribosomal protein L7/L12